MERLGEEIEVSEELLQEALQTQNPRETEGPEEALLQKSSKKLIKRIQALPEMSPREAAALWPQALEDVNLHTAMATIEKGLEKLLTKGGGKRSLSRGDYDGISPAVSYLQGRNVVEPKFYETVPL